MDKHKIRRAGVTALSTGLAAAGTYAASKGLNLPINHPNDDTIRGIVVAGNGFVGATGAMLGMEKIRQHAALRREQFNK